MYSLKIFMRAIRAPFFSASALSVFSATALCYHTHSLFHPVGFFLILFTALCFHAAANVLNDYEDSLSGCDDINRDYIHPFTGGSRVVQEKILGLPDLKKLTFILFFLGMVSGMILTLSTHWSVALFFPPAFIGGFFYTRIFSKIGWGEVIIFLNFGLLTTLSSFYIQCLSMSWAALLLSAINGILVVNILLVNEFPDAVADQKSGKRTVVVRWGAKRASMIYLSLSLASSVLIVFGAISGNFPGLSISAVITVPLGVLAFLRIQKGQRAFFKKAIVLTILNHFISCGLLSASFIVS
jgi:1,4-dihydroxy-2-naphthoate octaprenyltransferase